jgi:DNA-binding MarR family transcriptional regulator
VDELIGQWRAERPDLGDGAYEAMATIGRLGRIAAILGPLVERVFAEHGLGRGEFDVLAALRRSGTPFTLTPSVLSRTLMLSPGAMTNRLDRLEDAGHVHRALDPDNRRSMHVSLTASGRSLVDTVVDAHVTNEQALLAGLSATERRRLDAALRDLLDTIEHPPNGRTRPDPARRATRLR